MGVRTLRCSVVVVFTKSLARNTWPVQASTGFSVQARGRNQRDGLGWGVVQKDDFSWGRSFSSRRAACRRRSELLYGVLGGGVGGRHIGCLGRVSAIGRAAGVGGGAW